MVKVKIYKLTATGVITTTYQSEEDFYSIHPDETLWKAGKGDAFVGGYVREDHLAKLILNGLGGSRNREYLKLKRDLSNVQQELVAKKDDLELAQQRHSQEITELNKEIAKVKKENQTLEGDVSNLAKESREQSSKICEALERIKGVV